MNEPRFLIVRFSAIGDCVMTAHAATSIRLKYPDAHIEWAVEPRCAPVIDTESLVDTCVLRPRQRWKDLRGSPSLWLEQARWYASLRRGKYDFGIDFHGHTKTALCLRMAKPKRRIAARATDHFARCLNPLVEPAEQGLHTVEWNLCALREFGEFPKVTRPTMPSLARENTQIDALIGRRRIASISVSAGQPNKAYPIGFWRIVATALAREGFHVVFLGGEGDPVVDEPDATNLVGRLSLRQTMAVVARSELHLAADTGSGHIAAAYGVPVVSVFGPTDPVVYRPYSHNAIVLKHGTKTEDTLPDGIVDAGMTLMERRGAKISR